MNQLVGEIEVELDGKSYKCRPTFAALAKVESTADASIVKIVERFADGDIRLGDVSAAIYGCLPPGARLSYEQVGEIVLKQGLANMLIPAMQLVSSAFPQKKTNEPEQQPKEQSIGETTTE